MRAIPAPFLWACRRHGVGLTRWALIAHATSQTLDLYERGSRANDARLRNTAADRAFVHRRRYRISTSRFGLGQAAGSNRTPLGLHRVAAKIGGGWPVGTVFRNRQPVGFTWQGVPHAPIAHRILWLGGLEPGFNQGGRGDSYARYIYVHGIGDETTLGRPASHGCLHLSARDLLPLYDLLPAGTLVWIGAD